MRFSHFLVGGRHGTRTARGGLVVTVFGLHLSETRRQGGTSTFSLVAEQNTRCNILSSIGGTT